MDQVLHESEKSGTPILKVQKNRRPSFLKGRAHWDADSGDFCQIQISRIFRKSKGYPLLILFIFDDFDVDFGDFVKIGVPVSSRGELIGTPIF